MQRYFLQLAYNGTKYHGWQIQPNAISVQEYFEKGLALLTGQKIAVTGAGRTDTGVHASFYVAHFDLNEKIEDPAQITFKLNSILPDDISVIQLFQVGDDDHARFSALSRTYCYFISLQKDPFNKEFTARYHYPLDLDKLNEAAALLFNYDDFTSFSKLHTDVKTNLCKIIKAEWKRVDDFLIFEIRADRFLRNMVRAIVGTLVDVGRGKISITDFISIIEAKDRSKAGASAEACGLFLTDIEYPEPLNSMFLRNNSNFIHIPEVKKSF
jgi:tRNA pseudouridine38-40 synthase